MWKWENIMLKGHINSGMKPFIIIKIKCRSQKGQFYECHEPVLEHYETVIIITAETHNAFKRNK